MAKGYTKQDFIRDNFDFEKARLYDPNLGPPSDEDILKQLNKVWTRNYGTKGRYTKQEYIKYNFDIVKRILSNISRQRVSDDIVLKELNKLWAENH